MEAVIISFFSIPFLVFLAIKNDVLSYMNSENENEAEEKRVKITLHEFVENYNSIPNKMKIYHMEDFINNFDLNIENLLIQEAEFFILKLRQENEDIKRLISLLLSNVNSDIFLNVLLEYNENSKNIVKNAINERMSNELLINDLLNDYIDESKGIKKEKEEIKLLSVRGELPDYSWLKDVVDKNIFQQKKNFKELNIVDKKRFVMECDKTVFTNIKLLLLILIDDKIEIVVRLLIYDVLDNSEFNKFPIEDLLVETLKDENPDIIIHSVDFLNKLNYITENTKSQLLKLSKSKNEFIKISAINVLSKFMDPYLIKEFILSINEEEEIVSLLIKKAILQYNIEDLYQILLDILTTENREKILINSLNILGELNDSEATNLILQFLNHRNENIRFAACIALCKMDDTNAVNDLIEYTQNSSKQFLKDFNSVSNIGNYDFLSNLQTSMNENEIYYISNFISNLKEKNLAIEMIEKMLENNSKYVRGSALNTLGHLENLNDEQMQRVEDIILHCFYNDYDEYVRSSAINTIGYLNNVKFVPLLMISALNKKNEQTVREAALTSLGDISEKSCISELVDYIEKNDKLISSNVEKEIIRKMKQTVRIIESKTI